MKKSCKNILIRMSGMSLAVVCWMTLCLAPAVAWGRLEALDTKAMHDVTGQGTTNVYMDENTLRLYLDIHIEQYIEVDSVKAGYYYKDDLATYKNQPDEADEISDGTYAYINTETDVIQGAQGLGINTNTNDWDINWTGVKWGESEDEPMTIDGLIFRIEYDNVNRSDKQVTRILIGTSNMSGLLCGELNRTTGVVNPELIEGLDLAGMDENNPLLLQRDSLLTNWSSYAFTADGFWIDLNLDSERSRQGINVIMGYSEKVAVNYQYDSMDWWSAEP